MPLLAPDAIVGIRRDPTGKAIGHPVIRHKLTDKLTEKYGRDKYIVVDDKDNDIADFNVFVGLGPDRKATGNSEALAFINRKVTEFKETQATLEAEMTEKLEDLKEARFRPMNPEEYKAYEASVEQLKSQLRKSQKDAKLEEAKLLQETKKYRIVRTLEPKAKVKSPTALAGTFDELMD